MEKNVFAALIASRLGLQERPVANTLALLDEGCTIPFISRYRKERTGGLDEVQIAAISDHYERLKEIQKRKETVTKTITDLDKMTPELEKRIADCWDANELEDIYLPYRPKRRTRAQVARELGLEPLAKLLMQQRERDPERAAERYVKGDVKEAAAAIQGAQDIIAEWVSEDERSRQQLRNAFRRQAVITSKVVKAAKANPMSIPTNTATTSTGRSPSSAVPPTVCSPCGAARAKAYSVSASHPTTRSASSA